MAGEGIKGREQRMVGAGLVVLPRDTQQIHVRMTVSEGDQSESHVLNLTKNELKRNLLPGLTGKNLYDLNKKGRVVHPIGGIEITYEVVNVRS